MRLEIIQCRPVGFMPLSWLIMLVSGTNYSHYAFRFTSLAGEEMYIDATSKNISACSRRFFDNNYIIKKTFSLRTSETIDSVQRWFEYYMGTPYAYMSLFGVVLKIKGVGKKDKAMTCNEFVLRFLNRFFNANIKEIDLQDLKQTELHLKNIIKGLK